MFCSNKYLRKKSLILSSFCVFKGEKCMRNWSLGFGTLLNFLNIPKDDYVGQLLVGIMYFVICAVLFQTLFYFIPNIEIYLFG